MKRSHHTTVTRGAVLAVFAMAFGWAGTAAGGDLPATGQTTCWDSAGTVIGCEGTGQDGDIQAGKPLNYKDRGKGTIKDAVTTLEWEKKSDDGGIHDQDDIYTWADAFAFVTVLNNSCANDETVDCSANGNADCAGIGGGCGFAGHRDWRVPNIKELQSILNYGTFIPAVSPAFNNNCAGATVLTGSCTASNYWSSTTVASNSVFAWVGNFVNGNVLFAFKSISRRGVRAVRGGSE